MRSPRGQAELRCDRVQPHALDRGGLLGIVALVATGVLSAQEVSSTFDPGETTIACSSARWSWRGFWLRRVEGHEFPNPIRDTSTLMDLLSKAATVATLSFVVSSMLAMGAGLTTAQIVEPLRNVRLVALALLANFVLMPLGAIALAKVLWLDEPFGIGLLLLGCAAGAPFLPKLAELAKGNLAFAVGVMVVLMVVTVGYLPIVLPLLLRGITVDPWNIARSLVLLMLLPLAVGLVLKARYEDLATRVKPWLDWISNVSLILVILLITAANLDKVLQVFGTRGILAGLLLIAVGFGIGWLLGGPGNDTRRVMALGTGQRNVAASFVVASQSFSDPKVVVMVIVVAIVGLIILMPLSRALANR